MPQFHRLSISCFSVLLLLACKEAAKPASREVIEGKVPVAAVATVPALKMATVDIQQIFKDYPGTREAQAEIRVEQARIQRENNERMNRIREIGSDLEEMRMALGDASLPESRKQVLAVDLNARQQEGIALDRERREFIQRRNQSLNEKTMQQMKGIVDEIRKRVEEHAKAEDFDYVFDKAGLSTTQVPFFLYTRDAHDITGHLLEELHRGATDEAGDKAATDLKKAD